MKIPHVCQTVAVLSDIHSNYYALKACIDDARQHGTDCFVFLGDYVSGLADAEKTLDMVYEIQNCYPTVCIRGNRERYMLDHHTGNASLVAGLQTNSYLYTYDRLREKDMLFFANLPISDVVEINGMPIEIAHATKDNDRLYFEKDDPVFADALNQMRTTCLLTGHSHKQYRYQNEGKIVINPGSVGLPQGNGWRSQYALLSISGGNIDCTFRQVAYDMEQVIREQFQSGLVERGKYWAIGDLYGAMTGEECTKELLKRIYHEAGDSQQALCDESLWHKCAAEFGMLFSEEEILKFWRKSQEL